MAEGGRRARCRRRPGHHLRAGEPLLSATVSGPEASILDPATGQASPWDWTQSGVMEMNCLLCHTTEPNNAARIERIQAGQFGDAVTATLLGSGIVEATDEWLGMEPGSLRGGRRTQA